MGSQLAMRFAVCGFAEFCEARQRDGDFEQGFVFSLVLWEDPLRWRARDWLTGIGHRGNGQTRVASCWPGGKS
jgi:hypothetical protein